MNLGKISGGNMMSNRYYELYKKHCEELEEMMGQYNTGSEYPKKLKGAMTTELLRQEITKFLADNNEPLKASAIDSYIAGSKYEYDLLIVKEDAEPYMGLVYQPDDIIAVIESKAGGLFDLEKDTDNIAQAANRAIELNSDICFGYITISENVPANSHNSQGNPTVKHWDLTQQYLSDKIQGKTVIYAVTLRKGKEICEEGSDEEFYDFVKHLIGKY